MKTSAFSVMQSFIVQTYINLLYKLRNISDSCSEGDPIYRLLSDHQ